MLFGKLLLAAGKRDRAVIGKKNFAVWKTKQT